MLINFSSLPIPINAQLNRFFEVMFEKRQPLSVPTAVTLYPDSATPDNIDGYALRFECLEPNTAALTALVAFRRGDDLAKVIAICRCTKSQNIDSYYHIDGLPIVAFLNQWQMTLLKDLDTTIIDNTSQCKTLPLHWVLEDAAKIGERRVTKMQYALRSAN